jgi:Fe-Mn family superoxide dismutase
MEIRMALTLPQLPFARDALEPHMSRETLDFHYGKHHKTYVDTTNKLLAGSEFENSSLDDIVRMSSGKLFNNAAQVWNHNFFWNCLTPRQSQPTGKLTQSISRQFESLDQFKKQFTETALNTFGSGWTWLVKDAGGELAIVSTSNAGNPLTAGQTPLLTCDVWEHAYYIDHRNARATYLEHFWSLVNWSFVESNLAPATAGRTEAA